MNSLTFTIHPDHLLYTVVCAHPALHQLTDLDRLVLSGLLLSGSPNGSIKLSRDERSRLEGSLQVSPQQMSNSIKRLITLEVISRHNQAYLLRPDLTPLGGLPKRLSKDFSIKLVTNKQ